MHNTSALVRKHEPDIKKFGWLRKYDDSKAFLQEKSALACEETANYLVIQCINLAMEEKFAAMEQVLLEFFKIVFQSCVKFSFSFSTPLTE